MTAGPILARSGRLRAETRAQRDIGAATRNAMWELYARYYTETTRAQFERDLAKKHSVILLADSGDGALKGFSTLEVMERTHAGKPAIAVFTGDTIVDRDYWGQTALHRAFFAFLLRTKLTHVRRPVYWFLISKGYKTYLTLAKNFVNYWPRHDAPTPAREAAFLAELSTQKFADAYRPELGVLRFAACEGRLKDGVAPVDTGVLSDPAARFFVERNPGHARGDELCCLGKVDLALVVYFVGKQLARLVPFVDTKKKAWAQASS